MYDWLSIDYKMFMMKSELEDAKSQLGFKKIKFPKNEALPDKLRFKFVYNLPTLEGYGIKQVSYKRPFDPSADVTFA